MENSFVGLSGTIRCPLAQAIELRSIQSDITDPSATDIVVNISGSLGTQYIVNAISPIVGEFHFLYDESIVVASTGSSLLNVVINYIYYGHKEDYMATSPSRIKRPEIGKWKL